MVYIEHFSKWVELVPVPSKSSTGTAYGFSEAVLSRYRAPEEVITDQGGEFQGEFYALLAKHEITHRLASRDHSQSDGLAERMVQTMKRALRKCVCDAGGEN